MDHCLPAKTSCYNHNSFTRDHRNACQIQNAKYTVITLFMIYFSKPPFIFMTRRVFAGVTKSTVIDQAGCFSQFAVSPQGHGMHNFEYCTHLFVYQGSINGSKT